MNKLAENLAKWFGSAGFILFHMVWFGVWVIMHFVANLDPDWSALTLIVSLEAIFLSLFILRAENVATEREDRNLRLDLKTTKAIHAKLDKLSIKPKR